MENNNGSRSSNGIKATIISSVIALVATIAAVITPMYSMINHIELGTKEDRQSVEQLRTKLSDISNSIAVLEKQANTNATQFERNKRQGNRKQKILFLY